MRTVFIVPQGSRCRLGAARVGVLHASPHERPGHVQLLIRTPDYGWTTIVETGESVELPDGTLTVTRVDAEPASSTGIVTFFFESGDDDTTDA